MKRKKDKERRINKITTNDKVLQKQQMKRLWGENTRKRERKQVR